MGRPRPLPSKHAVTAPDWPGPEKPLTFVIARTWSCEFITIEQRQAGLQYQAGPVACKVYPKPLSDYLFLFRAILFARSFRTPLVTCDIFSTRFYILRFLLPLILITNPVYGCAVFSSRSFLANL